MKRVIKYDAMLVRHMKEDLLSMDKMDKMDKKIL